MVKKFILLCFLSCLGTLAFADPGDYEEYIADIEGRLDRTYELYQSKDINAAKREVQMAYFEVFENLEGPIRINISSQKSFEMEATFGEIRRMIINGEKLDRVQERIVWLKEQLREVQPAIEKGHVLRGQGAHGTYDNDKIDPYWHDYFRLTDDLLAESIGFYQEGDYKKARDTIRQAHYQGFKNSEMETLVRLHVSSKDAQALNQAFTKIFALAENPGQINELGYQVTQLLQNLEVALEGLPIPEKAAQAAAAMLDDVGDTSGKDWNSVVQEINSAVADAIKLYETGQTKEAIAAVQDVYFDQFEATGMEARVGARNSGFKTELEGYFTRMVSLMKGQRPVEEIQAQAQGLAERLAVASEQLGSGGGSFWGVALMSLVIILREGLEALLIVAAIVAYLVKNNHKDKMHVIRNSVVVALVASVITAAAFYWLFENAGAQRELLEGITMMIAVVVLFSMSYWLISKVEAVQWKAYLEGKIATSLTTGSLMGLWFASFLAVYREGAETVLFYQALLADANGVSDYMALLAGFVIGCAILVMVYIVMRFSVVRLPLKPFFIFTSAFMFIMAFVFAGKSVLELVEGKLIEPTYWAWVPQVDLLGIYPYRESVLAQAALLLAAVVAMIVLKRKRPAVSE